MSVIGARKRAFLDPANETSQTRDPTVSRAEVRWGGLDVSPYVQGVALLRRCGSHGDEPITAATESKAKQSKGHGTEQRKKNEQRSLSHQMISRFFSELGTGKESVWSYLNCSCVEDARTSGTTSGTTSDHDRSDGRFCPSSISNLSTPFGRPGERETIKVDFVYLRLCIDIHTVHIDISLAAVLPRLVWMVSLIHDLLYMHGLYNTHSTYSTFRNNM